MTQIAAALKNDFMHDHAVTRDDLARFILDDDGDVIVPVDILGKPFPLRDLFRGAVDFLVQQNRFSVAQRRKILEWVNKKAADPKNAAEFYEIYLVLWKRVLLLGKFWKSSPSGQPRPRRIKFKTSPHMRCVSQTVSIKKICYKKRSCLNPR